MSYRVPYIIEKRFSSTMSQYEIDDVEYKYNYKAYMANYF